MNVPRFLAPFLIFLGAAAAQAQSSSAAPTAEEQAIAKQVVGHWAGTLKRGGTTAQFRLNLTSSNGNLKGTFDWPDLGYLGAELLGVRIRDCTLRLGVPLPLGSLRLSGSLRDDLLEGQLEETTRRAKQWVTLPPEGTFALRRAAPEPVPYRVEPISFVSGGIRLAGQMYVPTSDRSHPGVVFIHGSGDSDRSDGAYFADRLARRGIISVTYDKRGVGESGGNWRNSSYQELARDAHAALNLLKQHPKVDARRVGYVARSEGAWVAPLAVNLGGSAFAALVSGPSVSVIDEDIDDYRVALEEAGVSESDQQQAFALLRKRHALLQGKLSSEELAVEVARAKPTGWFAILNWEEGEAKDSRVFRTSTIGYDPAPHLRTLGVPSLWLYGTDDTIIPAATSAARLMTLKIEPRPSIIVVPRADHALAVVEYPKLPGGVSKASDIIGDWIEQLAQKGTATAVRP